MKNLNKGYNTYILFLVLALFLFANMRESQAQPYLSNLHATKSDPLFTTYAAPLSRSEFIIDEGYQFKFYEPENGVDFETDTGGEMALAFKLGDQVRYYLKSMSNEPVITTSYSDLVKYNYEPFDDIRVNVTFQVYSSSIAIQNIKVTNNRTDSVKLGVYPFMNYAKGYYGVMKSSDNTYFTFNHDEYPDGWTTAHQVPYQVQRKNIYFISTAPDAFGSYNQKGIFSSLSNTVSKNKDHTLDHPNTNYAVEWGLVYQEDGQPDNHQPPVTGQVIFLNHSDSEILTEDAPKWGENSPNIPGNGYQGAELGNFKNPEISTGDSFQVLFTDQVNREQGIIIDTVRGLPATSGINVPDLHLEKSGYVEIPGNLSFQYNQDHTGAVISWQSMDGMTYNIYRRTGETPGRYDLMADSLNASSFLDKGLDPSKQYGYVVIAQDNYGDFSGHSEEVGSVNSANFFADITNDFLSNEIKDLEQSRVIAFQKDLKLQPGTSQQFRILRGVFNPKRSTDDLASKMQNLLAYDMNTAVKADEQLYSRIPKITFENPDREMMYWGAFSMMRQCMLPPEGQTSYNYNVYSREPIWGWGHAGQVFHENLAMLAYAFMDPESAENSQKVFAERMGSNPGWPEGYIPYRLGPYLNEVNYLAGEYSSSSPWFNYENWEIFKVSRDTAFVKDIYPAGKKFYNFWVNQRDDDQDGLSEWGGHAFWESTSDFNVIWKILGGWDDPHNANKVEAMDLNSTLVMEAKALAKMAKVLKKPDEADKWQQKAQERTRLINQNMWDDDTHFYYHVMKDDHSFTYQTQNDLKQKELIGFEPLWAGVADQSQAKYLNEESQNPATFGRPYGMPLMTYQYDENDFWTHSMYLQRNYLTFYGLLKYGYRETAQKLADKIFDGITQTLRDHHDFYEAYNVDERRPNSALHTYIWTGLVSRMILDLKNNNTAIESGGKQVQPQAYTLFDNYPNPFNPSTTIRYALPEVSPVKITIYNALGQKVEMLVNQRQASGMHSVKFDAEHLGSGVYFYQLSTPKTQMIKKMLLIK